MVIAEENCASLHNVISCDASVLKSVRMNENKAVALCCPALFPAPSAAEVTASPLVSFHGELQMPAV